MVFIYIYTWINKMWVFFSELKIIDVENRFVVAGDLGWW